MYLCKFDEDGRRTATVVEGVHFTTKKEKKKYLDEGYIETSAEDYAYYVGNKGTGANGAGYIRGADGKPTDAPAHTPSVNEKKQAIISQYESDKAELQKQLMDAIMYDDTDAQAEIRQVMADVDAQFDADIKKLEG